MRRDLKVNAEQDSAEESKPSWNSAEPEDLRVIAHPSQNMPPWPLPDVPTDHGNCLYFGPGGERCNRPALESGFCLEHAGNMEDKTSTKPKKVIAAIMAILALLWPVLGDVVKFIMRWIRQRHGL